MREMHKKVHAAMKMKKHHDHNLQGLEYKNKNAQFLHLFMTQIDQ